LNKVKKKKEMHRTEKEIKHEIREQKVQKTGNKNYNIKE
jgi:hypothetical protein